MMFAGMIRVENNSNHKTATDSRCHRCAVRTGAVSPPAAAGCHRRRSFRRPGYMRLEPLNQSRDSDHVSDSPTTENTQKRALKLPSSPSERWLGEVFKRDNGQESSQTHHLGDTKENSPVPSHNDFKSSFSFIQQSLETRDLLDVRTNKSVSKLSEWDRRKSETSHSAASEPHTALVVNHLSQSEISTVPIRQSEISTVPIRQSEISTVPIRQSEISTVPTSQSEISTVPTSQSEISTVPTSQSEISTVPTSQSEISTVPTSQSEISTVPTSQSEISTVPTSQSEISTVPTSQSEISTVPTSKSEISTVPISQSEISTVPTSKSEISTVLTSQSEISTVPTSKSEISTVPTSQSEISTVPTSNSEISTVPIRQSEISTVPTSQSEISTVPTSQSEISTIPTSQSEISTVPTSQSEISTVPIIQSEISTVQTSQSEISTVQTSQSENSTVPTSQSEISTVPIIQSEISTVPIIQSEISTVQTSQSENSTVPTSQSEISTVPTSQTEHKVFSLSNSLGSIGQQKSILLARELWLADLDVQISSFMTSYAKESVQDSDSGSLDTEVTSSFSIDSSDSTSASSVTSGYDSTTSSSDHSRDAPINKCEDVLQDCLQNNRTNSKIESVMVKLQRLQHKAVLDDDYDTEHFGKKLEELRRERATLKPGLPSRHPEVSGFLERLRAAVHRTDCRRNGEPSPDQGSSSSQSRFLTREKLLEEKHRIQKEMCDLQRRLQELQERSRAVEEQLEPVLGGWDPAQLRLMARALEDMISSEHRVSPPAEIIRLQEQERALRSSIKEATAKVVMSQRLGSSVLHEAKLAALSGNDFSSAKELKAEIRSAYDERDRLERKLKTLSTGSGRDLSHMKEQHNQIKLEIQEREAQYERSLKENTLKYIELLEDRLHSCGSPALEHIWEADLEACHLLLKGLDQRTSSISELEDLPFIPGSGSDVLPFTKEEADCAMLTALGGRWCPEADLQHSEFTKKLEEFLFCLEDASPEDLCGETTELAERCELISERLHYLEEQLQTAIEQHDEDLTHILTELCVSACTVRSFTHV
ncbi:disrupted in schizophrenia 1 protein isoform X2 [Carassius gibelio]|uniref:disrupted in schizophrenia 1 protein isoform X2 n=1 Tax=Carassius gibelio TaxID=101364 RepID=UPI002277D7BF|nr:disrupted in schizophrenia 1 protein isoform X2 [Carassius gibelio]